MISIPPLQQTAAAVLVSGSSPFTRAAAAAERSRYAAQVVLDPLGDSKMKTESTPKNIDEYIAGFPTDVQRILQEIRSIIRRAAPDAEEAIKYRMPTFVLNGNLVHFAAFERHIGFYPTPPAIEEFKDELSAYHNAKGSVQFPLDKPVPYGLIGKIVKFRVKEVREKQVPKPKRTKSK